MTWLWDDTPGLGVFGLEAVSRYRIKNLLVYQTVCNRGDKKLSNSFRKKKLVLYTIPNICIYSDFQFAK